MVTYNRGDEFKRTSQVGVGDPFKFSILNHFKIISINPKTIHVIGMISCKIDRYRKIQKIDFNKFLEKYEKIR